MISKLRAGFAVAVLVTVTAISGLAGGSVAGASSKAAPIVVGMECSCSGPFGAAIVPVADTYKAWVDTVNAHGGLDGHHVKIIFETTGLTPGKASTEIKTLLTDKVDVIWNFSLVASEWAQTVQASGIPVVGADPSQTVFYKYSDFYPSGQTNNSVVYAVAATAKQAGVHNMAELYCTEAPTCADTVPLLKAAGTKLGDPVVYVEAISAHAPNYEAQCLAAKQDGASSLFIGETGNVIASVAKSCKLENYDPTYLYEGSSFTLTQPPSPGIGTDSWQEYSDLPFFAKTAQMKKMNAAVTKYYPSIRTPKTSYDALVTTAWVSGLMLATAVKHSGMTASTKPTSKLIVKGLEELKNDTFDGMSPMTFKAGQDHLVNCWFVGHIIKGKASLANNGKISCEKGASS